MKRSSYRSINSRMWFKLPNGETIEIWERVLSLGRCFKAVSYRFFPRYKRETKVEEFVNLQQREMSVQEYSLNFTKSSKYTPS